MRFVLSSITIISYFSISTLVAIVYLEYSDIVISLWCRKLTVNSKSSAVQIFTKAWNKIKLKECPKLKVPKNSQKFVGTRFTFY